MSNLEFVEYIRKYCTDEEFVDAITGFYLDSQNDETGIKEKALHEFHTFVSLDINGIPNKDEVELLDIYEEILAKEQ